MSDEAEKAALEHAIKRCEAIQKRRDAGLPPYAIRPEIEIDFLAGVEWERKRMEDKLKDMFIDGFNYDRGCGCCSDMLSPIEAWERYSKEKEGGE